MINELTRCYQSVFLKIRILFFLETDQQHLYVQDDSEQIDGCYRKQINVTGVEIHNGLYNARKDGQKMAPVVVFQATLSALSGV